jgi:hypothetical protein
MSVFTRILVMISEQRPLFFFGLGGLILVAVGLGFGVRVVALFTDTRVLPPGNTLVAVVLIAVGMFSIFTGLVLSVLQPGTHRLSVINRVLVMISEKRPILVFGLSGLVLLIVGLVFGVRVLNMYSDSGVLPTGNALISIILIIVGMFSVFTGLILRALTRDKK